MNERIRTEEIPINETDILSEQNLEEYKRGCEEVASKILKVLYNVLDKGKRPTVLIPSRGALPIYFLAFENLKDLDDREIFSGKMKHFPSCILSRLSGFELDECANKDYSLVDVVVYPFTADVSVANNKNSIKLAEEIRKSATRAFLYLTLGKEEGKLDLEWYYFLMGKLNPQGEIYNPNEVVQSLRSLNSDQGRQIIILDTVISGRAASHITKAFKDQGHPVIAVLAVDSFKVKFQKDLKNQIISNTTESSWAYGLDPSDLFVTFPLVSEDGGAGLLGVTALNFANFNEEGAFSKVDGMFSYEFRPQSCVWALPPVSVAERYLRVYKAFINKCRNKESQDWNSLKREINELRWRRGKLPKKEIEELLKEKADKIEADETSSHIISIKLPSKKAENWIREFAINLRV